VSLAAKEKQIADAIERAARAERERDAARRTLSSIASVMQCEPEDDLDLVEAVRLLVSERDAARARLKA